MYNGIGLTTARGSGTNAYVQRNLSQVRTVKERSGYKTDREIQQLESRVDKKPNAEILLHDKKRRVEVKCMELQNLMEEQGYEDDEIQKKVSVFRQMLLEKEDSLPGKEDSTGRPVATETHQIAEMKEQENEKLRSAFGISNSYVKGSAFDPEARKLQREREMEERKAEQQKRYALVQSPSNSPPPVRHEKIEKAKKKRQKKDKHSDSESEKKIKKKKRIKERSSSNESEENERKNKKKRKKGRSSSAESEKDVRKKKRKRKEEQSSSDEENIRKKHTSKYDGNHAQSKQLDDKTLPNRHDREQGHHRSTNERENDKNQTRTQAFKDEYETNGRRSARADNRDSRRYSPSDRRTGRDFENESSSRHNSDIARRSRNEREYSDSPSPEKRLKSHGRYFQNYKNSPKKESRSPSPKIRAASKSRTDRDRRHRREAGQSKSSLGRKRSRSPERRSKVNQDQVAKRSEHNHASLERARNFNPNYKTSDDEKFSRRNDLQKRHSRHGSRPRNESDAKSARVPTRHSDRPCKQSPSYKRNRSRGNEVHERDSYSEEDRYGRLEQREISRQGQVEIRSSHKNDSSPEQRRNDDQISKQVSRSSPAEYKKDFSYLKSKRAQKSSPASSSEGESSIEQGEKYQIKYKKSGSQSLLDDSDSKSIKKKTFINKSPSTSSASSSSDSSPVRKEVRSKVTLIHKQRPSPKREFSDESKEEAAKEKKISETQKKKARHDSTSEDSSASSSSSEEDVTSDSSSDSDSSSGSSSSSSDELSPPPTKKKNR